MVTRTVVRGALAWVLVAAVLRAVVLLPEQCPPVTPDDLRAAASEAVGWFERNQRPDGRWLYRYDADAGRDLGGYNLTRHGGVTMSLYQAAAAGHDAALGVADAGAAWALDHLVEVRDGLAFGPEGEIVPVGATGLLVAGLAERRALTGDHRHDEDLRAMGRFLAAMVRPDGSVVAYWHLTGDRPASEDPSPFFTGEVYWALALLHRELPDEGWDAVADRVGRYLATARDDAEGWFPDISDHWAAYGLATQAAWPEPSAVDADLVAYAHRQAGLAGFQVRWESQRNGSALNELVRGGQTLGAGLGTLGEQLAGLWRLAASRPDLAGLQAPLAERAECVAGLLVERQVSADEADGAPEPDRTRGAWLQRGITQMDDQQHALSAVLLAEPIVASQPVQVDEPWGAEEPAVLLLAALVLALDPVRAARAAAALGPGGRRRALATGTAAATVVAALAAAAAGPLLERLDVSAPTLRIGAGLVLLVTALVDLARPRAGADAPDAAAWAGGVVPVGLPTMLRPAAVVVAGSAGTGLGVLPVAGAALAAGLVAALVGPLAARPEGRAGVERWVLGLVAAVLAVLAVALAVDGVYDV